jgi:phosphomevalonate decarboxylase
MTKSTAIAHPIQGLIKFYGYRDAIFHLPLHDSVAVSLAPMHTRATAEIRDNLTDDLIEIDGQVLTGAAYQQSRELLDGVRRLAERSDSVYARVESNFDWRVVDSTYAALTAAAAAAFELDVTRQELSKIARLGSGNAALSLTGGYSLWTAGADHDSTTSRQIGDERDLPMGMIMIRPSNPTDEAVFHQEAIDSAFMPCRVAFVKSVVDPIQDAIIAGDFSTLGRFIEQDTFNQQAVIMTGANNVFSWNADALAVLDMVRALRADGVECYFSADPTGFSFVNCRPQDRDGIAARLEGLGLETVLCDIGNPATIIDEHLF